MKEMPVSYHRILMRLEQKEQRMLRRNAPAPLAGSMEKLRTRIPYTVQHNLEWAFEPSLFSSAPRANDFWSTLTPDAPLRQTPCVGRALSPPIRPARRCPGSIVPPD